jgi:hypothetical protein
MDTKTSPNQSRNRRRGAILFSVGILLGLFLSTVIIWANFEAVFYGFQKLSSEPLDTLNCPLLMTTSDTSTVSAGFSNPGNKPVNLQIRADISSPVTVRREQQLLALAPGETKTVKWTVSSVDMDLGYFIFVKVYQYPSYLSYIRESNCGIFVFDLPLLSGGLLFAVTLAASLLCMLIGLVLWERNTLQVDKREVDATRAMKFQAVLVLIGMFFSFQGNWVAGIGLLAISLLMMGALLFFTLGR